jgi:hypothetical protein
VSEVNPYQAPKAGVAAVGDADVERLNRVASAQRLIIVALLVAIGSVALQAASPVLGLIASLGGSVVAIIGVVRLSGALGSAIIVRILYAIAMIIPLLNLLIMVLLSMRATRELRAGGYKVGFLGASQK